MCNIFNVYFRRNGTMVNSPCTALQTDTIIACADVNFTTSEQSQQYKAELKISGHGLPSFSFFTPLQNVSTNVSFCSISFTTPIPNGVYTIIYVVIYDSAGTQICTLTPPTNINPCNSINIGCPINISATLTIP